MHEIEIMSKWNIEVDIRDLRQDEDVHPNEIDTFLNRQVTYDYRFNERTFVHSLRVRGLWRKVRPTDIDQEFTLFGLPRKYVRSPIPKDELKYAIQEYTQSFTVRYAKSEDQSVKYNWMIGLILRGEAVGEVLTLFANDPWRLNYEPNRLLANVNLFVTKPMMLNVPIGTDDWFDNRIQYTAHYPVGSFGDNPRKMLNYAMDATRGWVTTHMSWTFNAVHVFSYANERQLLEHVARSGILNRSQERSISEGPRVLQRYDERLICLRVSDKAKRINAVIALNPVDFNDYTYTSGAEVDGLLQLADRYYYKQRGESEHNRYMTVYNQPHVLFVPEVKYEVIKQWSEMTDVHVYHNIAVLPEPTEVEQSTRMIETRKGAVTWRIPLAPKLIEDSNYYLDPVSTEWISVDDVEPCSVSPTLFGSRLIQPLAMELSESDLEDQFDDAKERFRETKGQLSVFMNNIANFDNLTRQSLNAIRNSYSTGPASNDLLVMKEGSREHLFYQMLFRDRLVRVRNDVMLPENKEGRIRNNSTVKMLGAYALAIKLMNNDGPIGNISTQIVDIPSLIPSHELKVGFLGAQDEPAKGILADFSRGKLSLHGYGAEGIGTNIRVREPLTGDLRLSREVIISDMDQAHFLDHDNGYEQMCDFLSSVAIRYGTSGVLIMKVNYPHVGTINTIVHSVYEMMRKQDANWFEHRNFRHYLARFSGQNPHTCEAFLVLRITTGTTAPEFVYKYYTYDNEVHVRYETSFYSHPTSWPIVRQYIPTIKNAIPGDLIVGSFDVDEADEVFNKLASLTSSVTTWRLNINDTKVRMFAKINIQRKAFATIDDERFGTDWSMSEYRFNMGLNTSRKIVHKLSLVRADLAHKFAMQDAIMERLDQKIFYTIHSIGGRDLAEAQFRKLAYKMVIQDPTSSLDPLLAEKLNIEIVTNPFEWSDSMVLNDNTVYLFLNVIMTDVSAGFVSRSTQMERMRWLASAIENASGTTYAYVNYYSDRLYNALMLDDSVMPDVDDMRVSEIYKLRLSEMQMSFGSYDVTDVLLEDDIEELFSDFQNVHCERVPVDNKNLLNVLRRHGVTLDVSGGRLIDALLSNFSLLELSTE